MYPRERKEMTDLFSPPTSTQLWIRDTYQVGRPHYLSAAAHEIWKRLQKWVDDCCDALISYKDIATLFYMVVEQYFIEEYDYLRFKNNWRNEYSEYRLEGTESMPTLGMWNELDKIVQDALNDGVRAECLESCFINSSNNHYFM